VSPPPPENDDGSSSRVLEAVPGQNRPPSYPAIARRNRWEGEVLLETVVDSAGAVTGCRVLRSSGHEVLDQAALTAVRRWRFRNGPGILEVPVRFVLR
jgi:protein TonB